MTADPPGRPGTPSVPLPHRDEIAAALRTWLPRQPWYAPGREHRVTETPPCQVIAELVMGEVSELAAEESGGSRHGGAGDTLVVLLVHEGSGNDEQVLHLPLVWHPGHHDGTRDGAMTLTDGYLDEATAHPRLMTEVLQLVATGARLAAAPDGWVSLRPDPGAHIDVTAPPAPLLPARRNTSVVFGDQHILKVFRRLSRGHNPQVELVRALASRGNPAAPGPLGTVTAALADGSVYDLATVEEFIPSGTDGWALATTSARDLFALHSDDPQNDPHPGDAGGDFAAEARRLGAVLASIHRDLAVELGDSLMAGDDVRSRMAQVNEHCEQACREVAELTPHRDALLARLTAAAAAVRVVSLQRIHGDLDLTEVLRTDRGWVVIDFEGDPYDSVRQRTRLRSPMRDVAGVLRSLDYAARHLLMGMPDGGPDGSAGGTGEGDMVRKARQWIGHNREAFLTGYRSVRAISADERALLEVFELDKAIGKAVEEARYRPGWLSVPLTFLSDRLENRDG